MLHLGQALQNYGKKIRYIPYYIHKDRARSGKNNLSNGYTTHLFVSSLRTTGLYPSPLCLIKPADQSAPARYTSMSLTITFCHPIIIVVRSTFARAPPGLDKIILLFYCSSTLIFNIILLLFHCNINIFASNLVIKINYFHLELFKTFLTSIKSYSTFVLKILMQCINIRLVKMCTTPMKSYSKFLYITYLFRCENNILISYFFYTGAHKTTHLSYSNYSTLIHYLNVRIFTYNYIIKVHFYKFVLILLLMLYAKSRITQILYLLHCKYSMFYYHYIILSIFNCQTPINKLLILKSVLSAQTRKEILILITNVSPQLHCLDYILILNNNNYSEFFITIFCLLCLNLNLFCDLLYILILSIINFRQLTHLLFLCNISIIIIITLLFMQLHPQTSYYLFIILYIIYIIFFKKNIFQLFSFDIILTVNYCILCMCNLINIINSSLEEPNILHIYRYYLCVFNVFYLCILGSFIDDLEQFLSSIPSILQKNNNNSCLLYFIRKCIVQSSNHLFTKFIIHFALAIFYINA